MKKCVIKDLKVVLEKLPLDEIEKKSDSQLKDGRNVIKQSQKKKLSPKCQNKSKTETDTVVESSQSLLYINLVNLNTHTLGKTCVPKEVGTNEKVCQNIKNNSVTHIMCMGCQKYNRNVDTDVNKENKVCRTLINKPVKSVPLKKSLQGIQLKSFQVRLDRYFNNNNKVSKNAITKSKEMSAESSHSKTGKSGALLEREIEPKKALRQRVKQNYAETTIDVSEEKESTDIPKQLPKKKIPVYKQIVKENKPAESEDLYDFNEPDLEKTDKRRKRNKYNVNRSKKFDRTMYEILQKIQAKEAKLKNNNTKKTSSKKVEEESEHKKYGEVIKAVMKNILEKVNSKNQFGEDTKNTSINVKSPKIITVSDKEVNINLVQSETDINITENHSLVKRDMAKTQEKSQKVINATSRSDLDETRNREISDNIFSSTKININTSDSDNFYGFCTNKEDERSERMMRVIEDFSRRSGIVSKERNKAVSDDIFSNAETGNENEKVNEESASEDEFYGFCIENASTPLKPKPRINVLSNVIINPEDKESPEIPETPEDRESPEVQEALEDRESPDLFFNLESDANSTLAPKVKYTPWRFNKHFKRNPHFIVLKNTALPCLKQDMVLEYNELKRIIGKSLQAETPKKAPTNETFESDNQENIHPRSSLFDYESFSPEKKENNEQNVLAGKKTKRNILMPTIDNYFNIQRNKGENENLAHRVIRNYSESNRRKKLASEQNDLIEKRTKKDKEICEQNSDEDVEKVDEEAANSHDDNGNIRLFEDPETEEKAFSINVPSKIYERKRRRKRAKSVDSENGAANPKKNAKNCMSKEEEAELEKWAKNFNSICDEIDKYELEIE